MGALAGEERAVTSGIFACREACGYERQIATRGTARHVCVMRADIFAFILVVFVLAGFVKGVIGRGLPTIGGVAIGQALRSRLPPLVFRRCF